MAEILGVVASGINVAQLAGQILTTGLELRRLFHEIRDAPESLSFLLGQIEVIAAALHELNIHDAVEPGISVALYGSLRAAIDQCQQAADHLSSTISDLTRQLQTSRGFRRRFMAAKLVLKKDSIARFEHRLYTAVQCLTMTQQLYIMYLSSPICYERDTDRISAWQRIQPDMIISRIRQDRAVAIGFNLPSKSPANEDCASVQKAVELIGSNPLRTRRPASSSDRLRSRTLHIGLPFLTGKLMIEMPQAAKSDGLDDSPPASHSQRLEKQNPETKAAGLKVRFQMPPWLTYRVFEIFVEKSCIGWQGSLASYKVHVLHDSHTNEAIKLIRSNDEKAMYQAFERREFTPRDRFIDTSGNERSLCQLALRFGAWKTCKYLLSLERELLHRPLVWIIWQRRAPDEEALHELRNLLRSDDFGDHIRFQLFSNFYGDVDSFNFHRRQIWSDDEFYHESFYKQRTQFAWLLALSTNRMAPIFFPHVLAPQGILRAQDIYTSRLNLGYCDDTLLHALAIGVGSAGWHDQETSTKWALVALDIIPLVHEYHELAPAARWDHFRTPLFASLIIPMLPWRARKARNQRFPKRTMSLWRHFRNMDIGIKAWLRVLKSAGVDLHKYGEREAEIFNLQGYGRHHSLYRVSGGGDIEICWDNYQRLDLELIGFQYGPDVDDWALWWLEPTDVFAGDFWEMAEPGDQRVPGAWVDD